MTISDRVREQRLRSQARGDLRSAKKDLRKAVDLKDPKFLGQAALAATRGPAGLAWFAAGKGLEVARERSADTAATAGEKAQRLDATSRREPAEFVKGNSDATRQARAAAKRELKRLNKSEKGARRFAPLWITALLGGAAVAGGTAYFLGGKSNSSSAPRPSTSPAPNSTPTRTATTDTADPEGRTTQSMQAGSAMSTDQRVGGGKHELHGDAADQKVARDAAAGMAATDSGAASAAATGENKVDGTRVDETTDAHTGDTSPVDIYREKGAAAATPEDYRDHRAADGSNVPTTGANTGLAAGSTPQPEDDRRA